MSQSEDCHIRTKMEGDQMIVKITQKGAEAFINSDKVLIVSPSNMVNSCGVVLVGGLSFEVDGTARELAFNMGWKGPIDQVAADMLREGLKS